MKVICPSCNGRGETSAVCSGLDLPFDINCDLCKGERYVTKSKAKTHKDFVRIWDRRFFRKVNKKTKI